MIYMRVLTDENGKSIEVREYPLDGFIKRRTYAANGYVDALCGFDIETSNVDIGEQKPISIMYLWQFGLYVNGQIDMYVGRKWTDFQKLVGDIKRAYSLFDKRRMVCLIHNEAFEFQFLRSVGSIDDMFAVKERVPVRFLFDKCLEMRCTYKLSNMSLSRFCEQEGAAHSKIGGFDYTKTRYPNTELSDFELLYGVIDVIGMIESYVHLRDSEYDTNKSIPYTSTGYIRREARERVLSNPKNRFEFNDARLTPEQYKLCKAATRGGNVHASCLFTGSILNDVNGYDKASSYPWQMVSKAYPHGKMIEERSGKLLPDACNIMLIRYTDLRVNSNVYVPYVSYSKCEKFASSPPKAVILDNGRVVYAPMLTIAITEIDYEIIERQYTHSNIEIVMHYVCGKRELPKEYIDYILELFRGKCELKEKDPYFYAKYKNKINAAFGMMLTDITREDIVYINDDWASELPSTAAALLKYYNNYKSFLKYQDGLYVTAYARAELQEGIDAVGDHFVYCDTDSVKFIGDHAAAFDKINKKLIAEADAANVPPVVVNGTEYRLGVWEHDCHYAEFCTHGAKKYAYVYTDEPVNGKNRGQLGITVAGLSKKTGARYLKEKGGLKAFTIGAIWDVSDSGRLQAVYDDRIRLETMIIDGHVCEVTSNVALLPTTYKLSYSKDYAAFLEMHDEYIQSAQ